MPYAAHNRLIARYAWFTTKEVNPGKVKITECIGFMLTNETGCLRLWEVELRR